MGSPLPWPRLGDAQERANALLLEKVPARELEEEQLDLMPRLWSVLDQALVPDPARLSPRPRPLDALQRPAVGKVLDQPAGHSSLRHHGRERVLLVPPPAFGGPHLLQLLLRQAHHAVGSQLDGRI